MLKKTLFGLFALFVFVSMPALATEQESDDIFRLKAHEWPVDFKPIELGFKIPVYMDVGLYFEINNKKDVVNEGIVLKQQSIQIYAGCSKVINIQTNFDMMLGARIERTAMGNALHGSNTTWTVEIRDDKCEVKKEQVCKTLSNVVEKRKIWVKLEKPKIYELDFGKNKHIANVILTVKPNWEAVWVDP
ncbi:MAG: hypothetical protein A2167_06425 [Planctomycetes bacterium RBG_13_46_10]|nr:MAG: hypothetical protein A2167_06425 [Planctomycetes bacterium RBG_13_46_10]